MIQNGPKTAYHSRALEAFLGAVHPDDRAVAIAAMQAAGPAKETAARNEFRVVDECYERTELVRGAVGYKELWPEKVANCKHQPVKSCPSVKAALTRARAFTRL